MSISNISFKNDILPRIGAFLIGLPKEVTALICRYLDSRNTVLLTSTCHCFRFLASNDPSVASLWDLFLRKDFPGSYTAPKPDTENFSVYKRLKTAVNNMKAGTYDVQTLVGHQGEIAYIKTLNGKLISYSDDDTIKTWDLTTSELLQTLDLSTLERLPTLSSCMKILDDKLIFVSNSCGTLIWQSMRQWLEHFNCPESSIACIKILDGQLISGSITGKIQIWDLSTRELLQTLDEHQDRITCMKILNGKLISGSNDWTIKIWDLSTGQLLQTLDESLNIITSMRILDGKLIYGLDDGTIKIWDLSSSTAQLLQTLNGEQSTITCMRILCGKFISGLYNGTIKIWDLSTGQLLQTLSGHQRMISCITAVDGKIISGSCDYTIKIWDFNPLPLPAATQEAPRHNVEIREQTPHAESMNPSILQCLGIITDKDYSELLGCRPGDGPEDDLPLRGIVTLKDLNIICPPSLEIQELSIDLLPANERSDFREQQVSANTNRLKLPKLCNQMLDAITAMDQEAKTCGKILYEGNVPWKELQLELIAFSSELNAIEKYCNRKPNEIIGAFSGYPYAALAMKFNTLIGKFHEVDRKHRIAKLRAYIHQETPLKVWGTLMELGILTLSDFQEKFSCTLRGLFHMQEFIENHLT